MITTFDDLQRFKVVFEGVELVECQQFVEAVAYVFAAYYIFNASFTKKMGSSLTFFTKYIFKINDATIKDKKVANIRIWFEIEITT